MALSNFARGHLAMLLFSLLIAGSFSFGVMIANLVEPAALTAMRFFLSGGIVGSFALFGPGITRRDFAAPWRYLLLGGLFAIYFTLMFEGLKTAAPVSATAVFTLTPIMTAVFGFLFLRQIATPMMALALAIGAAGAVWVIFNGDLAALMQFQVGRGEMIYFGGCVAHAAYIPLVRKLNRGESTLVFTFGMIVAGWIILTLISLPELLTVDWASLPGIFWFGLLYLAIFASSMSFFLLQYASMQLPAANVMAYTYLTPSWVILLELALGNGIPDWPVLFGIAATMLALGILLRQSGQGR